MNAHILAIGTELTIGQAVDTNSAWLAQQLAAIGIHTTRHITVSDDLADITAAIRDSAQSADLILISGGLGPTPDDLTRDALAAAMDVELAFHAESFEQIAAYFRSRNRQMHERNRVQAMIPIGAAPIENTRGTAPGLRAKLARAQIFIMPGVPAEMKVMFTRDVLPAIRPNSVTAETITQRTLKSFGMSESEIGEKIADLMMRGRNPAVGTSAADLVISIRINAHGRTAEEARALAERDASAVRERLGSCIFGEDDDQLETAVARLLIEQRKTVSTAESCTGGMIAKRLTDISGSSAFFIQGFVTYANEAKARLIGVPEELIAAHGAVSHEVAGAMAEGCRRASNTDYALAVTGIAGPTGGSPEKPVGLVYVALATPDRTVARELRLGENLSRWEVRDRAAKGAMNLLRLALTRHAL